MTSSNARIATPASGSALAKLSWEREIRLWAGLILFAFVTMHLLNHALGVFGIPVMEAVQHWRVWLWRGWPGTIALYGAAAVHVLLALKRIALRRTRRMPAEEAVQIVLGLSIPVLVIEHALGTRYGSSVLGTDDSYPAVLPIIYQDRVFWQTSLILVAWFHGVIGIHYAFRHRRWFARVRGAGAMLAFAIPLLAIAGFLAAGREAVALYPPPAARSTEQIAGLAQAVQISKLLLIVAMALLAGTMVAAAIMRRLRGVVPVRYVGHGEVAVRPGATLLEASREHRIPHPSLCGGRGRCATCRVLVLAGHGSLPEPAAAERTVLARISAPASVRLACQIRPRSELSVQILLPVIAREGRLDWEEEAYKWGVDRKVAILVVDIRAFTTLAKKQLPHDTVLLVNRFVAEITQAVEAHDGRIGMYLSDGVMAIFGLGGQKGMGSRDAVAAGRDMLKVAHALNAELGSALPMPLRLGVGIHCGPAVIARIGDAERGYMVTALGETVSIASRLESATKETLADMLVSDATLRASGLALPGALLREVQMRGHDEPIKAHAFTEPAESIAAA
ncbi:MAG: adenylate/guanylate cyclase domain-containing protein [Hyphomicrobiaceae bacterium]|nr:adenylate/guanylate cyclase domain-containing protein [Hyphomicrobiaceae bacterium]